MTDYNCDFINVDVNADGVAVCTDEPAGCADAINHEGHQELEALFAQMQRALAVAGG